jgi:hypothetical protein
MFVVCVLRSCASVIHRDKQWTVRYPIDSGNMKTFDLIADWKS